MPRPRFTYPGWALSGTAFCAGLCVGMAVTRSLWAGAVPPLVEALGASLGLLAELGVVGFGVAGWAARRPVR